MRHRYYAHLPLLLSHPLEDTLDQGSLHILFPSEGSYRLESQYLVLHATGNATDLEEAVHIYTLCLKCSCDVIDSVLDSVILRDKIDQSESSAGDHPASGELVTH